MSGNDDDDSEAPRHVDTSEEHRQEERMDDVKRKSVEEPQPALHEEEEDDNSQPTQEVLDDEEEGMEDVPVSPAAVAPSSASVDSVEGILHQPALSESNESIEVSKEQLQVEETPSEPLQQQEVPKRPYNETLSTQPSPPLAQPSPLPSASIQASPALSAIGGSTRAGSGHGPSSSRGHVFVSDCLKKMDALKESRKVLGLKEAIAKAIGMLFLPLRW